MKIPCEVAVKSVVPAIRALLAIELVENHKMKQKEAAEMLGITQTAISKYTHHVRGSTLSIDREEEVMILITDTAASLASGSVNRSVLVRQICAACRLVRERGLMCELCRRANPELDVEQCRVCFSSPRGRPPQERPRRRR